MKITITGLAAISRELDHTVKDLVSRVARETEIAARQNTPIKTGRARKAWRRQETAKTFTVENSVPYIERLEAGASKQAPRGIIGPTLTQVKGKLK